MRRNILIVYDEAHYIPWRQTMIDHLYSFARYSEHNVFYLNLAYREEPPWHIKGIKFDLVIFHYIFFARRIRDDEFERSMRKAQFIKSLDAVKVGLPQDEFFRSDYLCKVINEFELDYVFSVAPPSEWPKIYDKVDFNRVKFSTVLTGYIDPKTEKRIRKLQRKRQERTIDIGYRARNLPPWLGRHGILKPMISNLFQEAGKNRQITLDLSTQDKDTFYGDDWYKFLLRCKYTIGVEGGASMIDRDGTLRIKTEQYMKEHPEAGFEEIEAACFPAQDGYLQYVMISPRHLEACLTKTCQILLEGSYSGVLEPGRHYIEVRRDFSNLDEVLDLVEEDSKREAIVENAFNDIVKSNRYTYKSLVDHVISQSLQQRTADVSISSAIITYAMSKCNRLDDLIHPTRIKFLRKFRRWSRKNKVKQS